MQIPPFKSRKGWFRRLQTSGWRKKQLIIIRSLGVALSFFPKKSPIDTMTMYVYICICTYIGNKQFAKSYTVYVHNIPFGKLT